MIRAQKHTAGAGTSGTSQRPVEGGLTTASNSQHDEQIYDNEDLFPAAPNAAYGTTGKTIPVPSSVCIYIMIIIMYPFVL